MVVGYVFPTSAPKTAPQYLEGERGYVPSKFGQESSPFLPPRLQQLPWSLFPWETNRPGVTPEGAVAAPPNFQGMCSRGRATSGEDRECIALPSFERCAGEQNVPNAEFGR